MFQWALRISAAAVVLVALGSCGGGGGGADYVVPADRVDVQSGFNGNLDYSGEGGGGDGSVGGGSDGDGGVGAGGDFGQFKKAIVTVYKEDGTKIGSAETDDVKGMVTIHPGRSYKGALLVELRGQPGATYYEEGKNAFVPFPADKVIRAVVPKINKNIGITPFTEAAYRLLTEGSTAERAANSKLPTGAEMAKANDKVLGILNQQFPVTLSVDDITRLPFIKSDSIGPGSISINARGRYGLVNGAFSKQAAMFNASRTQPTLDALDQLANDLTDGVLDGMKGNLPAAGAAARTYDPNTFTGELSSALAEQSYRFGDDASKLALPKILNFGNTRYEGYLFDASLTADGKAIDTVSGWVGDNSKGRSIGDALNKLPSVPRVFAVFGNFGHGSVFLKSNALDSKSKIFAVGDNVNGELGLGNTTSTGGAALEITLPGVLTHIAGGFAHTVARLADGSVYTWGDNSFGQLGTGGSAASQVPVAVALPHGALAVAATNTASYALLEDGTVYSWGGSGGFGLLGDGSKNSSSNSPAPVTAVNGIVQITARDNDVAVLRNDGTVWQWGSFPSDPGGAYTPGNVAAPYVGGTPLPTQVAGLPVGVAVRKILTEQGVFAALLADGTVYEWGVYFDITAATILRDTEARRVLNLPPIRDMMPGGFIGYGVRPFDRLTAMGVDYHGGMWKIRGRVAEQFDPANPTLQRRPQGQSPRPDCASCHLFLPDWPLTPDAATSTAECVPPPAIHGGGVLLSLIHAETQCEECHNPARVPPAAQFPNGWLSCVKPTNLLPRNNPIAPPIVTIACTIPAGHSFTPPGTVCSTCHNSVIARPLNDPALACAQPSSRALPSINITATVESALNDANAIIAAGSSTNDSTPALRGTISASLLTGQSLRVLRNGAPLGTATVTGTNWSFTDPSAPNGPQAYTARVEAGTAFGPTSKSYAITIDTVAPTQSATVTGFFDDFAGTTVLPGGSSSDPTPTVIGSLSAALAASDSIRVLRDDVDIGAATIGTTATAWSFADSARTSGSYAYRARVVDVAGNQGALGDPKVIVINLTVRTASVDSATDDAHTPNRTVGSGGSVSDATPQLQGTLNDVLSAGQSVRVMRDGSLLAGNAAVTGKGWSFNDPGTVAGPHTYTARVDTGTTAGTASTGFAVTIDTTAPTQTVSITADSNVSPYLPVVIQGQPASIPADSSIPDNGQTNDPTPTITLTLSTGLGAGEELRVTRTVNGKSLLRTFKGAPFQFDESAGLVSIPEPDAGGSGMPLPGVLPVTGQNAYLLVSYVAQVFDAAENAGLATTFSFKFDYFDCSQTRATSRASLTQYNPHASVAAGSGVTCSSCHQTTNTTRPTPSGTFVSVPAFLTTPAPNIAPYWCRRP